MGCSTDRPSCVDVMDRARALDDSGADVVHLERGEPDFATPEPIVKAAEAALRRGETRYTNSTGLLELRQAVCAYYQWVHGVRFDPAQVIINAGSSPALLTSFVTLLSPGDEVVLPDPGYPSYRRLVELCGAVPVPVPLYRYGFRYTAAAIAEAVSPRTKIIVVNSPSNPLGTTADLTTLREIADLGPLIVADEVYQGLSSGPTADPTVLAITSRAVVVNSFSKAFAMTGWRLGYSIWPSELVARARTIHQDAFVCSNAFVQFAGVEALNHAEDILSGWRTELRPRRELLVTQLPELGFRIPCPPEGAFYVYAGLPDGWDDSVAFAAQLLDQHRVAVTPGTEFSSVGRGYIRFSYATPPDRITEGLRRIRQFLTG